MARFTDIQSVVFSEALGFQSYIVSSRYSRVESATNMNRMASMRKSLYLGARSALSFCKSTSSSRSRYGAPMSGGSIAANCTPVSQTCGPKVSGNAIRRAFSPSRVCPTSTPFSTKSNISGSIPESRCYASQIARLPGELGATLSLIPYYSALADSRLVSRIGASGDAAILQDNEDGTQRRIFSWRCFCIIFSACLILCHAIFLHDFDGT